MIKQILKNQRGSGSVVTIFLTATIAASIFTYVQVSSTQQQTLQQSKNWDKGLLMMGKVKTLANFLVATSSIACKEGLFLGVEDESKKFRCKFTGKQVAGNELKEIKPVDVGLSVPAEPYDENGFLMFDVDSKNFLASATDSKNTAKGEDAINIKGRIGFILYNIKDDPKNLNLKGKLGDIPEEFVNADKDETFVLVRVEVQDEAKRNTEEESTKSYRSYFAVRRPIAIPRIEVGEMICSTACTAAATQNINPACRGNQTSKDKDPKNESDIGEVEVNVTAYNDGPGILYYFDVEKRYDFRGSIIAEQIKKVPPKPEIINTMGEKDYLLPGEKFIFNDKVKCYPIEVKVTETIKKSRSRGTCWDAKGKQIPCPKDGAGSSVSISQHKERGAKVIYSFDFFKGPPSEGKMEEPVRGVTNYIEPARISKILSLDSKFPYMQETQSVVTIIPTH